MRLFDPKIQTHARMNGGNDAADAPFNAVCQF